MGNDMEKMLKEMEEKMPKPKTGLSYHMPRRISLEEKIRKITIRMAISIVLMLTIGGIGFFTYRFGDAVFSSIREEKEEEKKGNEEEKERDNDDEYQIKQVVSDDMVKLNYYKFENGFDVYNGVIRESGGEEKDYAYYYINQEGELIKLEPEQVKKSVSYEEENISLHCNVNLTYVEIDGGKRIANITWDPNSEEYIYVNTLNTMEDALIITLGQGRQNDYSEKKLIYNINTEVVTDPLKDTGAYKIDGYLSQIELNDDLTNAILKVVNLKEGSTGEGYLTEKNYYVDLVAKELIDLNELMEDGEDAIYFCEALEDGVIYYTTIEGKGYRYDMDSNRKTLLYEGAVFDDQKEKNKIRVLQSPGKYCALVGEDLSISILNKLTGEREKVEGLLYTGFIHDVFISSNCSNNKMHVIKMEKDNSDNGSFVFASMGIIDLETKEYVFSDLINQDLSLIHYSSGWFDDTRIEVLVKDEKEKENYLALCTFER